ncbi:helix-turn-helix transcriptional regulator [Mycobacterium sp. Y57]|uniref:helix-turn-helix transcriptional regulator n=1 Tax=Mycolicibacterium xanthum TaxID=2796469 RepID=UPI001C862992|nr:helix-turn-helix transcriptional regulator [Mycolicibacterium xanthum]MBX7430718.1 helix-turn-helix transcriptional regulator [Mycolicibacterium xanthum]
MDSKSDIRDFLTTRRAKVTPQQVNLPSYGKRRVPGLRREEVAALAGVSVDYYNRLERGNLTGVSDSVLESIASALQLDEAERLHLFRLAQAANTTPRARRSGVRRPQLSPSLQRVLDGMTGVAAILCNSRMDLLAASTLGRALYWPAYEFESPTPNLARFAFLAPAAGEFYPDWDGAANVAVALLRTEAGRNPHDPGLTALVGELSTCCTEFRTRWAAHNVRTHYNGTKTFMHPAVGELTLGYDTMDLPGDTGLRLTAYTAEQPSRSADGLQLLSSWAATTFGPQAATAESDAANQ